MLRDLLDRRLPLFDRRKMPAGPVPNRAKLVGRGTNHSIWNGASLLHMDIWHQNILVDENGRVTGIVDWDRALWGDPEIEFAVLDYCGISEPAFWEGYGQPRDESEAARIRQVFYLLYELQKYIVIRQGRGHDPASARNYKRQVMQIVHQYLLPLKN
jgi:fructosamine-3-kinase